MANSRQSSGSGGTYGKDDQILLQIDVDTEDLRHEILREEVLASNLMKQLTQKYGTKGKSAKYIFLQAFQEGQRADGKEFHSVDTNAKFHSCESEDSKIHGFMDDVDTDEWDTDELTSSRDKILQGYSPIAQALARPAAMVTQSNFVKRLEEQVKLEVARAGCPPPTYEMSWLYEEIRREGVIATPPTRPGTSEGGLDTYSIRDSIDEPEEKMAARLKIYKRAFSALILHFEALRPIMRDIKRNYDSMLALRQRQVEDATTVKRNIHHLELSLDEKMSAVRFEGFKQLSQMEKQCFLLMRHVDKQDMSMRTMTDILNKLEASLSEEHDLRRDSEDQRKLLIVEINELRRKLGMTPRTLIDANTIRVEEEENEQQQADDVITTEDPIILRRALEVARGNLTESHQRLTVLEADYADVIPRHEFEDLKLAMGVLVEEHGRTIETYDSLNSQIQGLQNEIENLTGQRNKFEDLVGDMRKRATPRPSWEKIAEHIEGGLPKWKTLYEGKSTVEIVPTLIQELTGKKLLGPPEYIQPMGSDPSIPKYLRYDKQVRLRNLSRRDVLLVIQDIWQLRAEQLDALRRYNEAKEEEASGGYGSTTLADVPEEMPVVLPFVDYITNYFENRFHLLNMRMEWIYNILETCRKLGRIEPKLVQFLDILDGTTEESVYHVFRGEIAKLRNAVIKKSQDTGQPLGSIQFGHFGTTLVETFPEKSPEAIQSLMKAASRQTGVNADFSVVKYITFFAMTDEGLVGPFVEEFANEFEVERLKYVYEVLSEVLADLGVSLSSAERENDPAGETDVSIQQVFSGFVSVDPTLPDDKLGAAMTWVFMGNASLPGATVKGLRLVEFMRQHIRLSEFQEPDEGGDDDDDEFERAVTDILTEKEAEELDALSGKAKKRWLQHKKVTDLQTVVRRLKGGAFLRYGPRHINNIDDIGNPSEGKTRVKSESKLGVDPSQGESLLRKQSGRKHSNNRKEVGKKSSRVENPDVTAPGPGPTAGGTKKDKKKKKAK